MLAVAGGKGGCGKTTTTWCLARALGARGRPPIVVDLDTDMPDLHVLADVPDGTDIDSSGPVALERRAHRTAEGIVVVPGQSVESAPREVLADVRRREPPVLLDTPAGAGPDAARGLRAADATVLVTTATRESLTDAAKSAAMARALDAPPIGTVVVGSDGSANPEALLGCETLAHVPDAPSPLDDQTVRNRYASVARVIRERNL